MKYTILDETGKQLDPTGEYFILHLNSENLNIARASLRALRTYTNEIKEYDSQLANLIFKQLDDYDKYYEQREK